MTIWNDIIKTATVGTNRIPWQKKPTEAWLNDFTKEEGEADLLRKASVLAIARKAGYIPQKMHYTAPKAAIDEVKAYLPYKAHQLFNQIEHAKIYEEWVGLAFRSQKIMEPDLLPKFLEIVVRLGLEEKQVEAIIGERGKWLAAQHEEWVKVLPVAAEKWETGVFEERLRYFKALRKQEPAKAKALLEETISTESINHLTKLLRCFQWKLNQEDEAFLEPLLDHRRKEVRAVVTLLLVQLPNSILVQRMKDRLAALMSFAKTWTGLSTKLTIEPPKTCTKEMERDGVNPNFSPKKMGKKAGYLVQMLAMVPPVHWENVTGWEINKIIQAAKNSDWPKAVLIGWSYAIIASKDERWAIEILKQLLADKELRDMLEVNLWSSLVEVADAKAANNLVRQYLTDEKQLFSNQLSNHPTYALLNNDFIQIDEPTTLCLLSELKKAAEKDQKNKRSKSTLYQPIYQLKILALHFPPTQPVIAALSNWILAKHQQWMQDHLDKAIQVLNLRHQMYVTMLG